jgi:hypothetical protein
MVFTGATAAFAGLLFVVGCLQVAMFWSQLRIMRRSLRDSADMAKAAKESAEAARMSADIAQKMERAFVTAEVTPPLLPLASEGREWTEDGKTMVSAKVILRNHGRTPAMIRTVDIGLVALFSPPVKFRSFPEAQHMLPPALVITASGSYELETSRNFIRSEWQDMVSGKRMLLCGGRILYDDVLDQLHETGFCWQRSESDGNQRYSVVHSRELNYFRYNLPKHSGEREVE